MKEDISKRILSFAEEHNVSINNKLWDAVIKKGGTCLCTADLVTCPCGKAEFDIEDEGSCRCKLFIKE